MCLKIILVNSALFLEELPAVTKAIDYDNLESNDPSLLVGCSMVNQTVVSL